MMRRAVRGTVLASGLTLTLMLSASSATPTAPAKSAVAPAKSAAAAAAKPASPAKPATTPARPVASAKAPALPRWQTLPTPGALPEPRQSGTFSSDDVTLWFASFGEGEPVILLHGGLGSSNQFGDIVAPLAANRRVIVMDSRGHGRSTRSARGISYRQMADDVIALLDHLAIERAAIVGWSDGGATGLDLALRHPTRLSKLLVIGTNYSLAGVKKGAPPSKTFPEYFARCRREYARLAPDAKQLNPLLHELRAMWASQPTFTDAQISSIKAPVLVALGEHDEGIRLDHVQQLAKLLPRGQLLILPAVSHFAIWQDPATFTAKVLAFLDEKPRPLAKKPPPKKPPPPAASARPAI